MAIKKKARQTDFIIVWEFRIISGKRREFEKAYGPEGPWAKLFRRDKNYIRTDLIRDQRTPRRYLTIDVWKSHEAYLRFKKRNQREYDELDNRCSSLTDGEIEMKIGEFYRVAGPRQVRP